MATAGPGDVSERRVGQPNPLIQPGIAAIIRDSRGRVLLHLRRDDGGWAPPSGTVEFGEDLWTAFRREVAEETGLAVACERLIGVYSAPEFQVVEAPDGRRFHWVTCVFACDHAGGELHGSDEGLEWRWFPPDDLPDNLLAYAAAWLEDGLKEGDEVVVR